MTWQSDRQDRSEHWDVYQQRYAASGAKVDAENQINTSNNGDQSNPAATALADGGWLVTWQNDLQDGSHWGIYQQRYAASGAKVGAEALVSATQNSVKATPAVTVLADGGWLVTWQGWGEDGSLFDVYQQRYHASGAKEGLETRVNTTTIGNQYKAAVIALSDGGWVVTWQNDLNSTVAIYLQRYAASGAKEGIETQVNPIRTINQSGHAITALADGGWLVTWRIYDEKGWGGGVYLQRYAVSGVKVGGETQVNPITHVNATIPADEDTTAVTSLVDGGWVVTWNSGSDIYQQRYDAVGNPVGG